MRIGLCLSRQEAPETGGGYTFQAAILDALRKLECPHEFYCFYYGDEEIPPEGELRWVRLVRDPGKKPDTPLNDALLRHHIELVWFFAAPSVEPVTVPYLYTVWDIQHRLQPYFPEVSVAGWPWDARERYYQYVLPRAAYVITGNHAGKHELVSSYNLPEDRVKILPLPTPEFVLQAPEQSPEPFLIGRSVKSPYLFYPAQFWPHKNHVALLLALKKLVEQECFDLSLVLTGSDKGNRKYIQEVTAELGLSDRVHFLGFVSGDELIHLYRGAYALVYPSFFGPDNLPPLEAFALGCPVIAARVHGSEEQMEDAALLFDPTDEHELARAVMQLHRTQGLRETLIRRGQVLARRWTAQDYVRGILDIAEKFQAIRRCWSNREPFVHRL